tara:strand:- start:115 stop:576 length:462 start_codon:yes stop_codon:yes gene_type:complete
MAKEDNLSISTTMSTVSDWVRVIKDGISTRISPANFATVIESSLASSVNKDIVREISSGQSFLSTDNTLLVDCTGGNVTVQLPNPSTVWDATNSKSVVMRIVQKISNSNSVTISQYNSENIYVNGAADTTITLTSGSSATIETNGTDFIVVGS